MSTLDEIRVLEKRLAEAERFLDADGLRRRLEALEVEVSQPDLWSDAERGRRVTTEYGKVRDDLESLERIRSLLADAEVLATLGAEEGDPQGEVEAASLAAQAAELLSAIELRALFDDEHAEADALVEVHAGAGGTDAQDWAEMLVRMYLRWAERRGFQVELDDSTPGQEAGILSATFIVRGRFAYGLLSAERGVHRLVRMSPFDAQHRRQTSFAGVEVWPFSEELTDVDVVIDEKDLRIDTFRSQGAGGQHVNKTDSAVRITHIPTGIVVSVQNERSQFQNKDKAMQILRARLAELERERRRAELAEIGGPVVDNAWGNQIRSYVLAPYQLVKDLRTGVETGNVDAVLDGDIDRLVEAGVRWSRSQR